MNLQIRPHWIVIVALAAGTSSTLLSSCSKAPPPAEPPAVEQEEEPAGETGTAPEAGVAQPQPAPAPSQPAERTAAQPASVAVPPAPADEDKIVFSGATFAVKSDMVLAKVAGKDIQLKDLLPIAEGTPERTLTADEFETLYQQAINREVVFQSARVRRMELDDEQRRLVEKTRLRAAREGFGLPDAERPEYEAKSNFTALELMGKLLERNLVKVFGGPPAEVTPQMIEKYYEEHRADFKELPEDEAAREVARQEIDKAIREKLQPDVERAYQDFAKTMLDDLKKRLTIKEYVVLEK